ncbi:uncharacterized protein LOC119448062 isoform X2 [Dermacentor silvarum]|uniref:uncharacterized protein LOC119448062 isoform X2 n=1 Tax=Dermacentor silvarum TaxID=543639 RepID=UPI0021014319|nr:uncharacterized protein LOC119448062 isoform X2 [Dermacentor silvarum]
MAEVQSTCEVTSGAGEAILGVKDALPGKALGGDGSTTCVDELQTFETRRLDGTSLEVVSGCTSSGFNTQTDASELPSEGRRGSAVPKSSSRSVPKKSCRSGTFFLGGDAGMPTASPTKSLERRPALFRSPAAESLGDSSERLRGGRDGGPVAHDARTGCATNLKLLAENLVNETAQHGGTSPRSCSLAPSEGPSHEYPEIQPLTPEEPADVASVTRLASHISEDGGGTNLYEPPADLTEAPSTGAFAPCPTDSASAYEIDTAANEPPLEAVVVQPAPRAPSKSTAQVLRVEVQEAPVRPEHFSGSEAPMAASTLPLNSEVPRNNRPPQPLRHPRPHAMPPIAAPLCTRWCCAKISMISMAIMSLFAAFMIYAFREAATWNTSSIRARFVATQALIPEAENITEFGILKRNVP